MTAILIRALIAAALCAAVAPLVLVLLRRGDVLDHPSERSSHWAPMPRGGGIAPAVGALVAFAVTPAVPLWARWAVCGAAALFGLIGLVEDVAGIRALPRLALQFVAAALVALLVHDHLAGAVAWRPIVSAAAVLWLVAYANAYNFMDGIDGISVAQAAGAGGTWFLVGTHAHSPVLAAGGAIMAGAALGFAPFNLPRARMFLGDVGSYFIGAWLAVVAVLGLQAGVPPEAVLAPLMLYAADTGTTLLRRVVRGERWYLPHRGHAYQRLGDAGWSHLQAASLVGACIVACGALGAASLSTSLAARVGADAAIVGVIALYLLAPRRVARTSAAAVAVS